MASWHKGSDWQCVYMYICICVCACVCVCFLGEVKWLGIAVYCDCSFGCTSKFYAHTHRGNGSHVMNCRNTNKIREESRPAE